MKLSRDTDRRDEPWRNGRGSTREIFREPPGLGAFLWRVSLATIDADAPFSAFPGYERVIVLAEGSGFELRSEAATIRVDPSRPAARFSGDLALSCVLLGGAARALNLIVDRARLRPSVEIWKHFPSSPRKRGSTGSMVEASGAGASPRNFAMRLRIVVCLEGRVVVDGAALSRFDAALIEDAEVTAASADARAALLIALPVQ